MKRRILVVDDDLEIAYCTLKWIECKIGDSVAVKMANNLEEAIQDLQKHSFDMVISDLQMPDGRGLEIFKFIEQHTLPTKFILFSSDSYFSEQFIAVKKPDFQELIEAIYITGVMLDDENVTYSLRRMPCSH